MPIKPENRSRYPKEWPAISLQARERAQWRCQHAGCRAAQYAVGHWELRDVPRPPGTRLLNPLPRHLRRSEWVFVPTHGSGPHDHPDVRRAFAAFESERVDISYQVGGGKPARRHELIIYSWDRRRPAT